MRYDFHGVIIETHASDPAIDARWQATFASRPPAAGAPDVSFTLDLADTPPPAPAGEPDFRQGDLLQYYLRGSRVTAHFPRFGQLLLDLASGEVTGGITPAALQTHGVFEDIVAVGLSPLLRRRGMFLLHAFAAATPIPSPSSARIDGPDVRAALLVGDIGAGKTTTGLALLRAGWKLLSNDSPILRDEEGVQILAYPGLLSAYPDTLERFEELRPLLAPAAAPGPMRGKTLFAAEDYYPGVWLDRAPAGALLFPQIEARAEHLLEPLPAPEALRRLLPHAVEQWDREMIPAHLALLRRLAETTPAYRLRLGPDPATLPAALAGALARRK